MLEKLVPIAVAVGLCFIFKNTRWCRYVRPPETGRVILHYLTREVKKCLQGREKSIDVSGF